MKEVICIEGKNMIGTVIALALGLMVMAIVAPIALEDLAGVDQDTLYEGYTETLGYGDGVTGEFEGYFDHVPDDGTVTVTWTTGEAEDTATGAADELTLTSGSAAWELDASLVVPDDATAITAEYDYTVEIDDASFTLLTVLLPIVAVIGFVLFFVKKEGF